MKLPSFLGKGGEDDYVYRFPSIILMLATSFAANDIY